MLPTRIPSVLLLLALPLLATAGGSDEPHARTFEIGGRTRSYTVFLPPSYATVATVPLVVDLHSLTSKGEGQRAVSGFFTLHADPRDGFVIAYPEGFGNSWNAGTCCGKASADKVDDVAFLVEMVHRILAEWPKIDAGRVYATGLSNGSAMTQRLGVEASDTFVAGVGYAMRLLVPAPEKRRPFAYMDFAAYQDSMVPYRGNDFVPSVAANVANWVALQGCKPTPRIERLSPPGTDDKPNQCAYYEGCSGGVVVASCSVSSSHFMYDNWDEINLARLGWEFMKRFHR